jgi:hypothetical protein
MDVLQTLSVSTSLPKQTMICHHPTGSEVAKIGNNLETSKKKEKNFEPGLFGDFIKRHFALAHSFSEIFPIRAAALDIVLNQFDMFSQNIIKI